MHIDIDQYDNGGMTLSVSCILFVLKNVKGDLTIHVAKRESLPKRSETKQLYRRLKKTRKITSKMGALPTKIPKKQKKKRRPQQGAIKK